MYAELINKYRATNKLKIVEVNAKVLCDLPNDLLQKLLEENTKLLTMSESEKKISAVDTAD